MRSRLSTFIATVAIVTTLAIVAAACGSSGDSSSSSSSSASSGSAASTDAATPKSCRGTGSTAHRDVRYASAPGVTANLQSLDLYLPVLPKGCPAAPILAYVHGGGFRRGDKSNKLTDKINLFTQEGWAFASLNYRLVGNPGSGPTNGRYPTAEEDVAAAIGFLADHATRYHLDARRIMLLGHSAGANLVALVSTDGSFLAHAGVPLEDIVCTVPLDTTYDIPTQVAKGGANAQMYNGAFGTDPAVQVKGSPTRNVAPGKDIPAFHIVTRGSRGRIAGAEAFGAALQKAGVRADVQDATGLTHEQVNAAVGAPGEALVTPALMSFYRSCVTR